MATRVHDAVFPCTVAHRTLAKQLPVGSYERPAFLTHVPKLYRVAASDDKLRAHTHQPPIGQRALVHDIRPDARSFMPIVRGDHVSFATIAELQHTLSRLSPLARMSMARATVWVCEEREWTAISVPDYA
jgi:hypothetical protein